MSRPFFYTLAGVLGVLCLVVCTGNTWIVELPFHLAFGWIWHAYSVAPKVTVNLSGIALFVLALPIAALLAHHMARWLWNAGKPASPWRWKWTLSGLAIVFLMFAAGMAATGVVHQTGWLIRSPEPLTMSNWTRRLVAQRLKCAENLRQIGQALANYANNNNGYRPKDQADMVRVVASTGGSPQLFVCLAGDEEVAPGTQPSDWAPLVATGYKHCSYVYWPESILGPNGKGRVVMSDNELHYFAGAGGVNVLYDDGAVEWFDQAIARPWMDSLRQEPTTRSAP